MIAAQTAAGEQLKICFKHEHLTNGLNFLVGRDARATARTECYILRGPKKQESVIATGVAFCSVLDQFNREAGRKVALTRAVALFDSDTRGRLWDAYLNRHTRNRERE